MSNRLRAPQPDRKRLPRQKPAPTVRVASEPPAAKASWVIGALGGLLLLALLVSAFSAWVILRHR